MITQYNIAIDASDLIITVKFRLLGELANADKWSNAKQYSRSILSLLINGQAMRFE